MIFLKSSGIWTLFVLLAVINGVAREQFISLKLDEHIAHVISSIILSSLIFMVTFIFIQHQSPLPDKILFQVGMFWVGLTITFEFLFGHYLMKVSWSQLIADYNIFKGRVWVLVLLSTLLAPFLSGKLAKF